MVKVIREVTSLDPVTVLLRSDDQMVEAIIIDDVIIQTCFLARSKIDLACEKIIQVLTALVVN